MEHPGQAGGLQGCHGGSCDTLAVNVLGTGSGWQQNKQNWAPLAVVGQCSRVDCRHLCRGEAPPLHLLCGAGAPRAHSRHHLAFCFGAPSSSPDRPELPCTSARLGDACAIPLSLGVREGSLLEHSLHQAEFCMSERESPRWQERVAGRLGDRRGELASVRLSGRVPRACSLKEHSIR